MAFTDDLAAAQPGREPGPTCGAGKTLDKLTADEQQAITDAIARGVPITKIADLLEKHNKGTVSAQTLQRHYRGGCRCPKSEKTLKNF